LIKKALDNKKAPAPSEKWNGVLIDDINFVGFLSAYHILNRQVQDQEK
jgi:hypothetical protein